jgi:glycosyltransferase involved in cell wall biosynthesis
MAQRDALNYVLITAARNEERVISATIESVVAQTCLPLRWVIVDDGSTDQTAAIVERFGARHRWIALVRRPARKDRSFAGKAQAVREGLEHVQDLRFEVMGNLDADVTFEPDYMEFVISKLAIDPQLGIAGTPFTEEGDYDSYRDSYEGASYVAGPCQIFRYRCFEDIGGYVPNPAGGVDWIAVMTARMKGWSVRSFPEKRFHHHRSMGTAERGMLSALFSYGEKDYYLGNSPLWQLFRVAYRTLKKPRITGGLALLLGYSWAAARRMKRAVSPELMRFHRHEQMTKLKAVGRSVFRLRKPDNFSLANASSESRPSGSGLPAKSP